MHVFFQHKKMPIHRLMYIHTSIFTLNTSIYTSADVYNTSIYFTYAKDKSHAGKHTYRQLHT